MEESTNKSYDDVVYGRNSVMEAVRTGREINKLLVAKGSNNGSVTAIIAKCKKKGIVIKEVPSAKLDFLTGGANHQGVAVMVASKEYSTVDEILEYARSRNEAPFIVICDGIEDSHNLGAIIRSAEATGVHGVIIPKHRSVTLNSVVAKCSSGALEYMKVAREVNLAETIKKLKKENIWVYAADMDGDTWCEANLSGGCALVIGSEGRGVSRLVKENCDGVLSLPMYGQVNSLNASVAAGIMMYEVVRQNKK